MARKTFRFRKKKKHKINDKKQPTKKGKGLFPTRKMNFVTVQEKKEKKQGKKEKKQGKKDLKLTPSPLSNLAKNLAHINLKMTPQLAHTGIEDLKIKQKNNLTNMFKK